MLDGEGGLGGDGYLFLLGQSAPPQLRHRPHVVVGWCRYPELSTQSWFQGWTNEGGADVGLVETQDSSRRPG